MSNEVVVGIDLGTSSLKAVAVNREGQVVGQTSSAYPTHHPHHGWDEQEPADWWRALRRALRSLRAEPEIARATIRGVGFSGQMHGAVPIGADGRPVRPAIIWSDARTIREVEAMEERVSTHDLVALTGNRANTGFTAPKIIWMRDHEPERYAKTRAFIQPKDALRLRLTDKVAGDVSDASATLLFDLRGRTWSDELCTMLGVDRSLLPPLFESPQVAGHVTLSAARATGLPSGIPVAAGGGDAPCAALGVGLGGAGSEDAGTLLLTLGTAGQAFAVTAEPLIEPEGRTHALCHVEPGAWYQMGAILQAGAAVEWLVRALGARPGPRASMRVFEAAASVTPAADDPYFLPYLVGERSPHLDPHVRGAFVGLASHHGLGHLARAVLEGVAFALRDAASAMEAVGVTWRAIRVTGGGARSGTWLQLLADSFAMPVELGSTAHGSGRGAALLGAVASGWFASVAEAAATAGRPTEIIHPNPDELNRAAQRLAIFRSLYQPLAHLGAHE
jgi:xylulokinase